MLAEQLLIKVLSEKYLYECYESGFAGLKTLTR